MTNVCTAHRSVLGGKEAPSNCFRIHTEIQKKGCLRIISGKELDISVTLQTRGNFRQGINVPLSNFLK